MWYDGVGYGRIRRGTQSFQNLTTNKFEEYHGQNVKSLPIHMKERRQLHKELMEIHNFERKQKRRESIQFFRMKLMWANLIEYFKRVTWWEKSIRELEIQRGTMTANVFIFIKLTLKHNLIIGAITVCGIILPYEITRGTPVDIADGCRQFSECANSDLPMNDPNRLNGFELSECCHHVLKNLKGIPSINPVFDWLNDMAYHLGGERVSNSNPLFYGYYFPYRTKEAPHAEHREILKLMYLSSIIFIFLLSFVFLVKTLGEGIQEIVQRKEGESAKFAELVFCGYDHSTKNLDEARFKRKLWIHELRVAIKEYKEDLVEPAVQDSQILRRILVQIACVLIIALAVVILIILTDLSVARVAVYKKIYPQTLNILSIRIMWTLVPAMSVTLTNAVIPNILTKLGKLENYSVEVTIVWLLVRTLFLRGVSLCVAVYTLLFYSYGFHSIVKGTCFLIRQDKPNVPCVDDYAEGNVTEGKNILARNMCWESLIAQELYKILVTDLLVKALLAFVVEPFRIYMKEIFFKFTCMRNFGTLKFNSVRHSLDIIYCQMMLWLGVYFAPLFPLACTLYLIAMFYIKKHTALRNCVQKIEPLRVTRTATIFLFGELLVFMFVLAFIMTVVSYFEPSRGCGSFVDEAYPWHVFLKHIQDRSSILKILGQLTAPSVFILVQMAVISYILYLYAETRSVKKAINDAKLLIALETKDKQFLGHRLNLIKTQGDGGGKGKHYDANAIYESEKKFKESGGNRRVYASIKRAWKDQPVMREHLEDPEETKRILEKLRAAAKLVHAESQDILRNDELHEEHFVEQEKNRSLRVQQNRSKRFEQNNGGGVRTEGQAENSIETEKKTPGISEKLKTVAFGKREEKGSKRKEKKSEEEKPSSKKRNPFVLWQKLRRTVRRNRRKQKYKGRSLKRREQNDSSSLTTIGASSKRSASAGTLNLSDPVSSAGPSGAKLRGQGQAAQSSPSKTVRLSEGTTPGQMEVNVGPMETKSLKKIIKKANKVKPEGFRKTPHVSSGYWRKYRSSESKERLETVERGGIGASSSGSRSRTNKKKMNNKKKRKKKKRKDKDSLSDQF